MALIFAFGTGRYKPNWAAGMAETIAELLERAEAAIREAKILLEISQHWQNRLPSDVDRMHLKAQSPQQVRAINYPQDVKEISPRYQASPCADEAEPPKPTARNHTYNRY